ncbi:hypothetical protein BGZ76_010632 [Entomortierella beljakovae]|nr:hypothetical protein BGZ76_010632 [Entomortierella beljakovae]
MRGENVVKCLSRQELNEKAIFSVVDSTSIRLYIRAAEQLLKQAKIYQKEGDVQTSYMLYMRYCDLVVTQLPKHPEYSNSEQKASRLKLKKTANEVMTEIEELRPIVDRKYNEYMEYVEYIKQQESEIAKVSDAESKGSSLQPQSPSQRDDETGSYQNAQQGTDQYQASNWSLAKALEGVPGTNTSQLDLQEQHYQRHGNAGTLNESINYPEYHRNQHPIRHDITTPTQTTPVSLAPAPTSIPPALPKKPALSNAPKLPPKIPIENDTYEFSNGLRKLIVPVRLLDRFLNTVRPNTIKNLETCGILAGVLSRNKLTVTTLIIPKQTATSDTCSTTNEDELFEYQSEKDLMTLGWIHTHPTQTCFMSSVDLHTHCSYQLMLPEAIAIVCAPKHEKELTDPPGLQVITNCREKPLFHQHPGEDNIYTDACDQGHVDLVDLDFEMVDLRKK